MNKFSTVILSLIAVLVLSSSGAPLSFADNNNNNGTDTCPNTGSGWTKYDNWADSKKNQTHDAGIGNVVSQVCVKGSTTIEYFSINETKSCWTVTGIGTQNATVNENWAGDDKDSSCKDISHASFYVIPGTTPTGVTPTGVTPTGVTPTGVTPTGVTPTGVTPTGVTPTGVTPTTPVCYRTELEPVYEFNPQTESIILVGYREIQIVVPCTTPTVTETPTATPTPTDVPRGGNDPTATPTTGQGPTETPTPTDRPLGGPGGGDGLSDGKAVLGTSTVNDPYKGVLGVNTMAKTGTFEQILMSLFGVLGAVLLAAGYRSYKKDQTA